MSHSPNVDEFGDSMIGGLEAPSIVPDDAGTVIVWARSEAEAVDELARCGVETVGGLALDDVASSAGFLPFRYRLEA
jgi:hypothetical protein